MTDTTLHFTRDIAASPHAIWRCWTEPALLEQWFAPKPVRVTDALIEPFPGGRFDTTMHIPDVPAPVTGNGCVLVAEPGRRFAFTNLMSGEFQPNVIAGEGSFPFSAEIVMTPRDTGCTYAVTVRHADAAGAKLHSDMGFFEGWGTAADQMAALAATL